MEGNNEIRNESQPQKTCRVARGQAHVSGGKTSGLSDYYIADATLTPVDGGHIKLKFKVLHKETNQPGGPYQSMYMYSFDKSEYCTAGEPRADGSHESIFTPSQPGPGWVKITTQGHCPITDPDHIRLVY